MISCSKNILTIRPALTRTEIHDRLSRCSELYVAEWLPRVLATDLSTALESLLAKGYSWLSAEQKQQARKEVGAFTIVEVRDRFKRLVAEGIGGPRSPDVQITFVRTLRVPDDGKTYPLPPGLGPFAIENLAHYSGRIPSSWAELGGVMIPMHQSEAMWINFKTEWPTALKIATGTVNAINGGKCTAGLTREPQGYVVLPEQPWLDGYCAAPGMVRQFVATILGQGYSAEEQILGTLRGGLQLEAYPVKVEPYFEKKLRETLPRTAEDLLVEYLTDRRGGALYAQPVPRSMKSMGLGAGGRIKQEVYEDQWETGDWDMGRPSKTWVHLVDSAVWKGITGKEVPGKLLTAKDYAEKGFPWFDYYREDIEQLDGSAVLANLKSVVDPEAGGGKGDQTGAGLSYLHVKAIGPDGQTDKVKEWDGTVSTSVGRVSQSEADISAPKPSSPFTAPTISPGFNITAREMQRLSVAIDVMAGRMSIKAIAKKHAITKAQLETILGVAVTKIGAEPKPESSISRVLQGYPKVKILLYLLPFIVFLYFIFSPPNPSPRPHEVTDDPLIQNVPKSEISRKPEPPLPASPRLNDPSSDEVERITSSNADFYRDQEKRNKEAGKHGESLWAAAAALLKPDYTRPTKTPNGSPWPTTASYISGYEKRRFGGLSKLKVDNTRHNRDVMALLVNPATEERFRACHIPAGSDFELLELAPGTYDIRYMDLDSGETFKTEPFTMTETPRFNSTEYSEVSLTIYRVVDGNMETTRIPRDQFPE